MNSLVKSLREAPLRIWVTVCLCSDRPYFRLSKPVSELLKCFLFIGQTEVNHIQLSSLLSLIF